MNATRIAQTAAASPTWARTSGHGRCVRYWISPIAIWTSRAASTAREKPKRRGAGSTRGEVAEKEDEPDSEHGHGPRVDVDERLQPPEPVDVLGAAAGMRPGRGRERPGDEQRQPGRAHQQPQPAQLGRSDRIGAAVWATGHAGRVIVEAGLTRPWLEFRGGIVYSPAKDGLDLGEACVDAVLIRAGGAVARLVHGDAEVVGDPGAVRRPDRLILERVLELGVVESHRGAGRERAVVEARAQREHRVGLDLQAGMHARTDVARLLEVDGHEHRTEPERRPREG